MLELYVVRHGETEWNVENRLQGQLDSNLTEMGVQDAEFLGVRFQDIDFDAVYVSPSKRTQDTAKYCLLNRNVPIVRDERLLEINLGIWQGKTVEEIIMFDGENYSVYEQEPAIFQGSGESLHDVRMRVEEFLHELERSHPSGKILVITHGVVIKILVSIIKNVPLEFLWEPPNIEGTSVTIVNCLNGNREILAQGDCTHKYRHLTIE